jgi:hypothetical protein
MFRPALARLITFVEIFSVSLADTAHEKTLIVLFSYDFFVGELSPEQIPIKEIGFIFCYA